MRNIADAKGGLGRLEAILDKSEYIRHLENRIGMRRYVVPPSELN